jgi:hypothetical protein
MHLSAVAPLQTSQPAGQATMLVASRKNLGAAVKHSATEGPKHKIQLATQALIAEIAEFVLVKVVPTKYLPHPSFGAQSIKDAALVQVHLSIL